MDGQRVGCGYHDFNDDGSPAFDHTCDDCMLPEPHLDPPELNDFSVKTYGKIKTVEGGKPTLPPRPF